MLHCDADCRLSQGQSLVVRAGCIRAAVNKCASKLVIGSPPRWIPYRRTDVVAGG
jgi:hypothetical protein